MELGDAGLKETVAGKTVHLDTPFGVAIPITYHGNGLMSGTAGVLEYFLGAQADRGRWWVSNGKLCQKWFKWLDAQPSCMRLKRDGNKIIWRRDDGLSGTATIASGLPPGAQSPPSGVGGPRQPPERAPALAAAPEAAPAKAAMPPPAPRRITRRAAALTRAAPRDVPQEPQPTSIAPPDEPGPGAHAVGPAALERPARGGMADRWCQAAAAEADAAPELVRIARLAYGDTRLAPPPNACLAAEPPLQNLARAGIDAR